MSLAAIKDIERFGAKAGAGEKAAKQSQNDLLRCAVEIVASGKVAAQTHYATMPPFAPVNEKTPGKGRFTAGRVMAERFNKACVDAGGDSMGDASVKIFGSRIHAGVLAAAHYSRSGEVLDAAFGDDGAWTMKPTDARRDRFDAAVEICRALQTVKNVEAEPADVLPADVLDACVSTKPKEDKEDPTRAVRNAIRVLRDAVNGKRDAKGVTKESPQPFTQSKKYNKAWQALLPALDAIEPSVPDPNATEKAKEKVAGMSDREVAAILAAAQERTKANLETKKQKQTA